MTKNLLKAATLLAALMLSAQFSFAQSVNPGADPNEGYGDSMKGSATQGGTSSCNPGLPTYCAQCCEAQKSQLRLGDNTTYRPNSDAQSPTAAQDGAQ